MNKLAGLAVIIATFPIAPMAAAADIASTKSTSVQQDANGNYTVSTRQTAVDASGNSVRVDTGVNADNDGNAQVTKRVESNVADTEGNTSHVVTSKTTDTNGREKTVRYEEHSH